MDSLQFAMPVRIVVAGQPVEEIYGVEQALDFLAEWPADKQGRLYQKAFNACFGASVGITDSEEAFRALAAFCRVAGLVSKDMARPAAARRKSEPGRTLSS